MKAEELMQKARQAVASARALHGLPDMDGACNRAYYAMFDAARAALMRSGAPVGAEVARTHSGLITAFGLHLVNIGAVWKFKAIGYDAAGNVIPGGGPLTDRHNKK